MPSDRKLSCSPKFRMLSIYIHHITHMECLLDLRNKPVIGVMHPSDIPENLQQMLMSKANISLLRKVYVARTQLILHDVVELLTCEVQIVRPVHVAQHALAYSAVTCR